MTEKIKIYLANHTYETLLKDAELFEFFKTDGKINRNAFLNVLIENYYDAYQSSHSVLLDEIKEKVRNSTELKGLYADEFAGRIVQLCDENAYDMNTAGRFEKQISMKPTKVAEDTIEYIESCRLQGMSASSYFRTMFSAYSLLPQDRREQIIFRKQYEAIEKAIQTDRQKNILLHNECRRQRTYCFSVRNCQFKRRTFQLSDL